MLYREVYNEQAQAPSTREPLYEDIEEEIGKPVLSFFVGFHEATMIHDNDANLLESALRDMDLSDGLALIVNAPGGDGLVAERICHLCRSYSDTGEYTALVPGKAKSAATMICFGADEIYMGPSSELGPIDPQTVRQTPEGPRALSARNVIDSYENLFDRAADTDGNLEPFLQQLKRYDSRNIKELEQACALSNDIAAQLLATGMMAEQSEDDVKDQIDNFREPDQTKSHGRPIYRDEAQATGLEINYVDQESDLWDLLQEVLVRTDQYLRINEHAKSIEGKNYSFAAPLRS